MIYFDNAATTFPKPECVYQRVEQVQRTLGVNVGRGGYQLARQASELLDTTRAQLASLVGASSEQVYFTPSATYGANQVLLGLPWDAQKVVFISPFDHNAVARPLELLRKQYGFSVTLLPFDPKTQELDQAKMQRLFAQTPPDYVFINHVSNVTGAILPLDIIGKATHERGGLLIVDSAQSLGLLPYRLTNSPVDFLLFAGHKNLYGSFGVGGFLCNTNFPLTPALAGGTGSDSRNLSMAEEGSGRFEIGSPNILAIASLNASLTWLEEIGLDTLYQHKKSLTQSLITGLEDTAVKLYLPKSPPIGTISFTHPDYTPSELGTILDQDFQIAVRTGHHCAPYIHSLLGTDQGTVRVSLGYFNTQEDIDCLQDAINQL